MIMCDYCADFFHPECVDISKEQALSCATYKCPSCVDAMKDELLYDEGETLVNTLLTYM